MMPSMLLAMPLVSLALVAAPAGRLLPPRTPAPHATTIAPVAADGWRFHWKVTVESDKKERSAAQPSMQVSLIPGKARVDYEGETNAQQQGMMKKGGYMILDAENGAMIMVDPKEKKAVIMDPSALSGAMNAIGATGLVKMDVKDVKVSVEKLGSGEKILGYATTRYRTTRSYVLTVSVMGRKNSTTHNSTTESWVADRFIDDRAFEAWAKNFTKGFGAATGDAFKKLMEAEAANQIQGIVVKQVMQSTDTDDKGNATTSKTTMEMTELAKTSLDASLFEVPKGYEVTDMKAQMAGFDAEMEKAKAECEAKNGKGSEKCTAAGEGSDSTAKMKPKDAAKKALRGIFKKP
ncbi:MAG: DUF4412 domain-containing protein [Gemmatimonadaceae bacterium]|nr:DUF4412 domain-containing protein [Gemmatimonadaceae bacterium]